MLLIGLWYLSPRWGHQLCSLSIHSEGCTVFHWQGKKLRCNFFQTVNILLGGKFPQWNGCSTFRWPCIHQGGFLSLCIRLLSRFVKKCQTRPGLFRWSRLILKPVIVPNYHVHLCWFKKKFSLSMRIPFWMHLIAEHCQYRKVWLGGWIKKKIEQIK